MIKSVVKKVIESILDRNGYGIEANNLFSWPLRDPEFMSVFRMQAEFGWQESTGLKIQRMYMVRNLLLSVRGLRGDWAECVVFKESTSLIMAEYDRHYRLLADGMSIHLFDSFEGLAEPSSADSGTQMVKGDSRGSEGEVRENLFAYDKFAFHAGWIPDRFEDVSQRKFAFVHIDVDSYEPVRDSLDFFLPRMVDGGVIVLDDYGLADTPGAMRATDEVAAKHGCHVAALPYGQAFIMVRRESEAA